MREILLVQHGQSQHHVDRDARLWPDEKNTLTELGRRQAGLVAARLKKEFAGKPFSLYASAMRRAAETADIVGRHIGQPPSYVPELREYNGQFAMERTEDGPEWEIDMTDWSLFDWRPFPEAETWREFFQQVSQFLERLETETPDDVVPLLVVHGGTLSNIVTWWLRLPLDVLPEHTPFAASPGSISVLQRNRHNNPIIERLNDTAHLRDLR